MIYFVIILIAIPFLYILYAIIKGVSQGLKLVEKENEMSFGIDQSETTSNAYNEGYKKGYQQGFADGEYFAQEKNSESAKS